MGHDSVEAALIYQHATSGTDKAVAASSTIVFCASGAMTMDRRTRCGCARAPLVLRI